MVVKPRFVRGRLDFGSTNNICANTNRHSAIERYAEFACSTASRATFISKNNIRRSAEYTYQDKLNSKNIRFIVDKSKQKVYISETSSSFKEYAFKDILGCEIVVDSQVTGGIKRAIVGGVLAGDAGAVVGAVTAKAHIMSYKLVLYLRNISAPKAEIELITQKTKTKDTDYTNAVSFAENVVATVKAILASVG